MCLNEYLRKASSTLNILLTTKKSEILIQSIIFC